MSHINHIPGLSACDKTSQNVNISQLLTRSKFKTTIITETELPLGWGYLFYMFSNISSGRRPDFFRECLQLRKEVTKQPIVLQ